MRQFDGKLTSDDAVIDAEYIVVAPEVRIVDEAPRKLLPAQPAGMAMLDPEASSFAGARAERGSPLFWTAGLALVAMAFWAAGGHALIRSAAPAAPPASELRIASFNSRIDDSGVRPMLVIDGEAVNEGRAAAPLPSLEIQVTSGNGATTRYKLGTAGASLAAGNSFPFSGRLDLPKHGVKTVSVAFVE